MTAVDKGLPKSNKARTAAGLTAIPKETIVRFLSDRIEAMLPPPLISGKNPLSLEDALPDDLAGTAESLVDQVVTLPWSYQMLMALPLASPANDSNAVVFELADGYSIRAFAAEAAAALPLHSTDPITKHLFHQEYPEKITPGRLYFTRDITGYVSDRLDPAVDEFVDAAKGFIGLCAVAGILEWKARWHLAPTASAPVITYRMDAGVADLRPYQWLSSDDSDLLLRFIESEEKDHRVLMHPARSAFAHPQTRSAARWYLDSYSGTNGLLQVVQATVALEILLGDRREAEEVGLTALLANRLAYLIGRTPTERQTTLKRFRQLYDLRSQIVHAGKSLLSAEERTAVYEIRELARKSILRHIEQLYRESSVAD